MKNYYRNTYKSFTHSIANDDLFVSAGGVDDDDFFDVVVSKLLLSSSKYFSIAFRVNSIFFKIFRSTDFSFISSIIGGFAADIVNDVDVVTSAGIVTSTSFFSGSLFVTLSTDATFVFVDWSDVSDDVVLLKNIDVEMKESKLWMRIAMRQQWTTFIVLQMNSRGQMMMTEWDNYLHN